MTAHIFLMLLQRFVLHGNILLDIRTHKLSQIWLLFPRSTHQDLEQSPLGLLIQQGIKIHYHILTHISKFTAFLFLLRVVNRSQLPRFNLTQFIPHQLTSSLCLHTQTIRQTSKRERSNKYNQE